mmetsp:Transcript_49303/g.127158  ORF Transcript_49303/g.127158 Transcript_49303/m.127158 type:complete len:559 (+) Transcript_49303:272-1948(+)|eukprot:CAMPEP_0195059838 /NCGR_PEP_ID=MMETSP0448-20130528/7233_1 /TAXON_ID=66468 /ORGANISM="Heterocapsa triquestra, Strain CCMP 448" /LENGTH=558 /DNA_ID=CAMNT_0040090171 /DNA_START=257 /DNA_END=1936 /DNA_ORIENTATION=+
MSDGFVTVAQCVEGLPAGRFVWELLLCAFLSWFLVGSLNESAPLAFSFVAVEWAPTVQSAALLSAVLALGNFIAVLAGGWVADRHGRLTVVRASLLMTICCGLFLQTSHTFGQALMVRFSLGIASGGLLGVMMPIMAELLPARGRGFYLTVWCCGYPAGALFSIVIGCLLQGLSWCAFYTIMLIPACVLYILVRAEMMIESPRYLYLAGRREEGYNALLDMYEKEEMPLPWAQETISVTVSSPPRSSGSSTGGLFCMPPTKQASSNFGVTAWLCVTMFLISAASQSVKIWMPAILDLNVSLPASHLSEKVTGRDILEPLIHDQQAHAMEMPSLPLWSAPSLLRSSSLATASSPFQHGPGATSLFSLWHHSPPLLLPEPNYGVVLALSQAYAIEMVGVIVCAYAATWVFRRQIVQFCLPAAAVSCLAALLSARGRFAHLSGPLVGLQLATQACAMNFLMVFAAEHFPTSRRAKTVAFASFAAQVGNFVMPVVGGLVAERTSAQTVVLLCCCLYIVAWVVTFRLPLPAHGEHPLHDIDEQRSSKSGTAKRKREWMTYQTL